MHFKGKINFVDYGSDDFSNFYDLEKSPHTKGHWFLVGVSYEGEENGFLFACDAENINRILRESECCRISQLIGRDFEVDRDTKEIKVIK